MNGPDSEYDRSTQTPRWGRILIGCLLLFGALFFGSAGAVFFSVAAPDYNFASFLILMSIVFGLTGIRLIRMKSADHLYSPRGSMVGGLLTVSIGAIIASYSLFYGAFDVVGAMTLPIVMGALLYWNGKRRLPFEESTNEHDH